MIAVEFLCSHDSFQVNAAWTAIRGTIDEDETVDLEEDSSSQEDESGSEYCWTSDDGSEWSEGHNNQDLDQYYDYGDLDETGGRYAVELEDSQVISLEEHAITCGCSL